MKRVFLIQYQLPKPAGHWFNWLRHQLWESTNELHVEIIEMPDESPVALDAWVNKIDRVVSMPNNDTYLVGYGFSAFAILSYLSEKAKARLGGIVLVGSVLKLTRLQKLQFWLSGHSEIAEFLEKKKLNWETISEHTKDAALLYGIRDPVANAGDSCFIRSKLGGPLHEIKDGKYLGEPAGYTPFPRLLSVVKGMIER